MDLNVHSNINYSRLKYGNNLSAHQQMNGYRSCGNTHTGIFLRVKEWNAAMSAAMRLNLENIMLGAVS